MITVEDFVRQETACSFQVAGESRGIGDFGNVRNRFFCCNAEDGHQQIGIGHGSCLVNAQSYFSIVKIAEVDFLAQGDGTQLGNRNMIRQLQAQGIKENFIQLLVSQSGQLFAHPNRDAVNSSGDFFQAFRSVINGIETAHGCKKGLCGTDIGSRFFTLDMLLAGLKCHAVTQVSVFVF